MSRRFRITVTALAALGAAALATALWMVLAHPTPACYVAGQAGVCPIPGRSLAAIVVAMCGLSCVVLAGVAALLGLSTQLDDLRGGERTPSRNTPSWKRPAQEAAQEVTQVGVAGQHLADLDAQRGGD